MVRIGTEKRMAFWPREVYSILSIHLPQFVAQSFLFFCLKCSITFEKVANSESGEVLNHSKLETS